MLTTARPERSAKSDRSGARQQYQIASLRHEAKAQRERVNSMQLEDRGQPTAQFRPHGCMPGRRQSGLCDYSPQLEFLPWSLPTTRLGRRAWPLKEREIEFSQMLNDSIKTKWRRHKRVAIPIERLAEIAKEGLEMSRRDEAHKAGVMSLQLEKVSECSAKHPGSLPDKK